MIFVTGGAGFIGSTLIDSLLTMKESVTIFDNFSNSSEEKISHLLNRGASLVKGDIRDYDSLKKNLAGFNTVIHLAAKIDVEESFQNPEETNAVNVAGTKNLLKACHNQHVKNIVVASSAAVYGNPNELPLSETSPTIPISPYGESKLAMEQLISDFSQKNNLNSICLRFFNIYGKGQTDAYAGVISKFIKNIHEDTPLTIFGDGSNTRDFISVYDVVDSIKCAIKNIDNKRGNSYNIASGHFISIIDLANLMLTISGKTLEKKFSTPRKGDIPHSQASVALAKNELNFIPKIPIRIGLEKLLKFNLK